MRISFADHTLDTESFELRRDGEVVDVEPQVFDLIALLAQNPGRLITKDELQEKVWGGRIVSDSAISARITAARKAVGDNGKDQRIIRTAPRRGIQFVAEVTTDAPEVPLAAPARLDRPTIRYARTKDGANIAYSVTGSGPPLIRSMHFPTHLEMEWDEPAERKGVTLLSEHFTVIRYDQRGCGLSDRDLSSVSNTQAASDLMAVADAAGAERFALMGMSSGGRYAVVAAASHPERITKLVLQGAYVDGRDLRQSAPEPIISMVQQGWNQNNQAFTRAYLMMYFPDAPQDWLEFIAGLVQSAATQEAASGVRKLGNTTSIVDHLPLVAAPTLILHSRDDAIHPVSEARKMAAGIANSELVVLDSPNHYILPHEADWDFHLSRIIEFLKQET